MLHLRRRHRHATSRPGSRAYFVEQCTEGTIADASAYSGISVLGKTLSFTVDLSQVVAALPPTYHVPAISRPSPPLPAVSPRAPRHHPVVSQATCGCVVAAYLVPMRANRERGSCDDYYCDANKVRSPRDLPAISLRSPFGLPAIFLRAPCDQPAPSQVCGVGCSEVDLMEANTRAFLTTTHTLEPDC